MDSSLRTSASGMMAQQQMIDVIANNLANVNTTGFKRSRVSFEDVLYETVENGRAAQPEGAEAVAPVQVGKGVRIAAV
ncbi:MAG TPA: flagellar hook-basal body complex protein, partial [Terriglobales bacterium]|nr:flagellar hook-basal body complex protein [Terriglobales bacterium]